MFAVLQTALDQSIGSDALEEAVMATQTLAKPDCTWLRRELFGIVAGQLSREDALAMQAVLRRQGVTTQVVDEAELPVLPPPKRAQAFHVTLGELRVQEFAAAGERVFPKEVFAFAAGGHVLHLSEQPFQKMEWVAKPVDGRAIRNTVEMVADRRLENVPEFRVEFYLACEPYRLQWILDRESMLRANDKVLHLKDTDQLNRLLALVAALLPVGRVNQGIMQAITGTELVYPSIRAFEEEIIWSFYRLMAGAP